MARVFESIASELKAWIERQKVFFVATAPLAADGHVNCSPKGMDSFRVLGPNSVGYVDLTGSGAETIAHLRENGRLVIMFCAFDGPPKIVRLHGRGTVIAKDDEGYAQLASRFPEHPGARAIIRLDVSRVSDSCGFSVPLYEYAGERDTLTKWSEKKGPDGLADYRDKHNAVSLDGLPAITPTAPGRLKEE